MNFENVRRRRIADRLAATMVMYLGIGVASSSASPPTDGMVAAPVSSQDDPARADALEEREAQAAALFAAGRYDEAIAVFEALHGETGKANYLYNIARIHEEDGHLAEALVYYDRFVHARGADLEMRTKASARALAIRSIVEQEQAQQQHESQLESTHGTRDSHAGSAPAVAPEAANRADEPPAPTRKASSKMTNAGFGLLGVGGAALVVGGVFGGLAMRDDQRLDENPGETPASIQERGQRRAWIADGLFIGGGVVAATGLTLVLVGILGGKRKDHTAARRLQPSGGPALLGFGLSGRM